MGVTQIGGKLVRELSGKSGYKTVVSETTKDGKIITGVLDNYGKKILERVKTVDKFGHEVGNKKVKTTTRVTDFGGRFERTKTITDRIYDKNGKFLGVRGILEKFDNFTQKFIKDSTYKQNINDTDVRRAKHFYKNGKVRRKSLFKLRPGQSLTGHNAVGWSAVDYNERGLPYSSIMRSWEEKEPFKNSTLKEMRDYHLAKHPDLPYADMLTKQGFSDKSDRLCRKDLYSLNKYL